MKIVQNMVQNLDEIIYETFNQSLCASPNPNVIC